MRPLAYAKRLLERRAAGAKFWLAIVAVGWLRDTETLADCAGIARVGCPLDLRPQLADWSPLIGLDVLLVMFEGVSPDVWGEAVFRAWGALPATLWQANGDGTASRILAPDAHTERRRRVLAPSFRHEVALVRECALLCEDQPLFCSRDFDAARQEFLRPRAA